MNIDISVIIPTYNREKVFCNTLNELFNQNITNFEIIVIDQTPHHEPETEIFLKENFHKIKYHKITTPNLPAARNFGVNKAIGEIIVFFDDDMLIPEGTLDLIFFLFKNYKICGLTGLSYSPDRDEKEKFKTIPKRNKPGTIIINNEKLVPITTLPGFFMCFRKEVFKIVGGFDEWIGTQPKSIAEDHEFCVRVEKRMGDLFIFTGITVLHLSEKTGGCSVRQNYHEEEFWIMKQRMRLSLYCLIKNKNLFSFQEYIILNLKSLKSRWRYYNYNLIKLPVLLYEYFNLIQEINYILKQNNSL